MISLNSFFVHTLTLINNNNNKDLLPHTVYVRLLLDLRWNSLPKIANMRSKYFCRYDAGKFSCFKQEFRDKSGLRKGTIPKNSDSGTGTPQKFSKIPKLGKWIPWKVLVWEQVPWTKSQKSQKNSRLAKGFIPPTEGDILLGQEKFDHWQFGLDARNSLFTFVSVYYKQLKILDQKKQYFVGKV